MNRQDKWDAYADSVDTTTPSKRATFELTADHAIGLMSPYGRSPAGGREGRLLDIGCGFGEIDILLAKKTNFQIIGCDISDKCVEQARRNVEGAGMSERIKIEKADVYSLPYKDNSFDVVVSFGYTSAATYEDVQNEVSRILKPNGLLICDFINPLCLYRIIKLPKHILRLRDRKGKYYNIITAGGISEQFRGYGLNFISQRLFNTYPPINFFPASSMVFFDRIAGRILSKVLGRVRIVCFQKR